jgi:hypothetical protein
MEKRPARQSRAGGLPQKHLGERWTGYPRGGEKIHIRLAIVNV